MSPAGKNALRTIMVGDAALLTVVGGLALRYVDGTPGRVFALLAFCAVAALVACLPLTDPYRWERRERRRHDRPMR